MFDWPLLIKLPSRSRVMMGPEVVTVLQFIHVDYQVSIWRLELASKNNYRLKVTKNQLCLYIVKIKERHL